jgi:Flp pilus assembly protein TadG
MAKSVTTQRKSEAGQSLIFVALLMFVLLAIMGLGIDMGYMRYQKGRLQEAADAGAIAGAAEVLYTDTTTAADAATAADGFTNGSNNVTVTVNHPPLSGPSTGNSNYVEVIVAQSEPTFFMKVVGLNSVSLSSRAVAEGSSPNCIYGLGTSGDSLDLAFLVSVNVSCGVVGDASLGGFLASLTASSVALHGSNGCTFCSISPSAQTGIPVASDPFASLPAPAVGGCGTHPTQTVITTTVTLSPGTYCGGIDLAGGHVTFNSGTYVLDGGGLTMTSALGGTASGTGVTFYNTGTASGSCTTCYGSINSYFTFGSTLVAPTTGTYAGILFFQDRSNPQQANFDADASIGTRTLTGSYYFPDATVSFLFNFGNSYTILVAKQVSWALSLQINDDYSSLPGGSPIKNTGVLTE